MPGDAEQISPVAVCDKKRRQPGRRPAGQRGIERFDPALRSFTERVGERRSRSVQHGGVSPNSRRYRPSERSFRPITTAGAALQGGMRGRAPRWSSALAERA